MRKKSYFTGRYSLWHKMTLFLVRVFVNKHTLHIICIAILNNSLAQWIVKLRPFSCQPPRKIVIRVNTAWNTHPITVNLPPFLPPALVLLHPPIQRATLWHLSRVVRDWWADKWLWDLSDELIEPYWRHRLAADPRGLRRRLHAAMEGRLPHRGGLQYPLRSAGAHLCRHDVSRGGRVRRRAAAGLGVCRTASVWSRDRWRTFSCPFVPWALRLRQTWPMRWYKHRLPATTGLVCRLAKRQCRVWRNMNWNYFLIFMKHTRCLPKSICQTDTVQSTWLLTGCPKLSKMSHKFTASSCSRQHMRVGSLIHSTTF